MPSGIGMALQQYGRTYEAENTAVTGQGEPLQHRGDTDRSILAVHTFSQAGFGIDGKIMRTKSASFNQLMVL